MIGECFWVTLAGDVFTVIEPITYDDPEAIRRVVCKAREIQKLDDPTFDIASLSDNGGGMFDLRLPIGRLDQPRVDVGRMYSCQIVRGDRCLRLACKAIS